jgi:hypothetical protein
MAANWAAKDGFADVSIMEMVRELQRQAGAASGNLLRPEAMLVTQAHTLDLIAHSARGYQAWGINILRLITVSSSKR